MVNRSRVKSGQESVRDYPRPPRLEDSDRRINVVFGGVTLAYTTRARRVLETSHPPVYYVPPEDYGGWITAGVLGPFKGGPGTWGW